MTQVQALTWLTRDAFPLWLEHGVDWRAGAFFDDLDHETLRPRATYRRLRVAARQTYVFAHAARLGVPRAEAAAALGLNFLRTHARQEDGGYASRFDLANRATDTGRDLYDHAFVLLAFAHTGAARDARGLLSYLDTHFIHPEGGWRESLLDALPRRQNPHMHLLEALLAAAEAFGDEIYLDRADALIDLFLDRLLAAEEGGLPEYFDQALVPLRDSGRFVLEPGHHHEWVWLLDEHRRIASAAGRTPRDTVAAAADLMAFAERHGVAEDSHIAAELWSDGTHRPVGVRVWPFTERLKALSRHDPAGIPPAMAALWRFFDGVRPGLWWERMDGRVPVPGEASPASTLYHVTCALLEVSAGARQSLLTKHNVTPPT